MFIIYQIFLLFTYIAQWSKSILIFCIWAATFNIGVKLINNDVSLNTPWNINSNVEVSNVDDFNMSDFTTHNQEIPIMFSKYAPEIGDAVNCMDPCDRTNIGEYVPNWLDKGIACPPEIPAYTKIRISNLGIFSCVDTGGWIQIVQKGERDDALTNSKQYFNRQNNIGDPNEIVYAEETHMWVDLMTTVAKLDSYPDWGTKIYDWEIIDGDISYQTTPTPFPTMVETPVETTSCPIQKPYEYGGLTQDIHGADSVIPQPNSLDYSAGRGLPVLSPISGEVILNEITDYGNTTIIIQNDCYKVLMYHGDWSKEVGTFVEQGEQVGTEGNNGYVFGGNGNRCEVGDTSCGNHTHLYVEDALGNGIDPRPLYGDE